MSTAVVYYSMLGNSEMVAEHIAKKLGADVIRIEPDKAYPDKGAKKFLWGGKSAVMGEMPVLKSYEFDASKYDEVIIGFPVWASRPAPPIWTFINEQKDVLREKKIAVFACQSGNGAEKAFDRIKKQVGGEKFEAELILIDPKTRVNADNDGKIDSFCDKLHY
ncbi:Flavodoxin [Butyrivibrio sp. INlla18]|uniref:flavodoxin family protein n=1 Tax=Butyrivibrio sp. INlla18 TaxID=1520806 RepID=UPI00088D1888|nr:flavodoxin [Butyrivibrio sp. INlla18]SDA38939.1 Flavodoxin [Butyrivibrio sp. INlla18]